MRIKYFGLNIGDDWASICDLLFKSQYQTCVKRTASFVVSISKPFPCWNSSCNFNDFIIPSESLRSHSFYSESLREIMNGLLVSEKMMKFWLEYTGGERASESNFNRSSGHKIIVLVLQNTGRFELKSKAVNSEHGEQYECGIMTSPIPNLLSSEVVLQ